MGFTEKQDAESVGFVPKGNEAAAPVVKRIEQGGATVELDPNGATLRNAGLKDNNNTTSPTAWQTDPWYDRRRPPVDNSTHKDVRDPLKKTGVPQDVGGVMEGQHGKNKPKAVPGQTQPLLDIEAG